ncbi:putative ssDNA binding protein [Piedraia hortae CBS 480.64]|uniref:Putative ssDNA binding protein n=1 Tax=Piedraia hortae CBS 480.64 TaxID=1314780 RepID=A0A6A7C0B3_9PEZI|nr:putative ssDNA binding protein [Piedraia hortae CBS 480.64]
MSTFRTALSRSAVGTRAFTTTAVRPLASMQLIGRLADTPELSASSSGREFIRYAVAVNYGPRDEMGNRATSWFNVTSFADGPQRDFLLALPKGTRLFIEADARMETRDTQEGGKRSYLNLVQRRFEALSRPQPSQEQSDDAIANASAGGS